MLLDEYNHNVFEVCRVPKEQASAQVALSNLLANLSVTSACLHRVRIRDFSVQTQHWIQGLTDPPPRGHAPACCLRDVNAQSSLKALRQT